MKKLLLITIILISQNSLARCLAPIFRTNINQGQIPTSLLYNSDFNNLYAGINNIPGDCIADNSLDSDSIQDEAITEIKIANGSVTAAKIAIGAIPPRSRLMGIRAFTGSSTYSKRAGVDFVLVELVGGGGGAGNSSIKPLTSGESSSFGSFCTATGGERFDGKGLITDGGYGGSGSGGDINLAGDRGKSISQNVGHGGQSFLSPFGDGAMGEIVESRGGGSGGYCSKIIQRNSLPDSTVVTVGGGGTFAHTTPDGYYWSGNGQNGLVLVYEYGN